MCRLVLGMGARFLSFILAGFLLSGGCSSSSFNHTTEASNRPENSAGDISFDLSFEKLAKELSTTPEALKANTQVLADYLSEKSRFESICPENHPESREELCSYISDIEERPLEKSAHRREPVIRLNVKNLNQYQSVSYEKAARAVGKIKKNVLAKWVPNLLLYGDCPRNISAAALRKLEENLPGKTTTDQMEALYNHVSSCLKPSDTGFEILHFRQALIRKMNGDINGARVSIALAVQATNPQEKGRALYWQGAMAETPELRENAWKNLTEKQPMTYHSLLAWRSLNQDPFKTFSQRPVHSTERATPKLSGRVQKTVQWLEALYLIKKNREAEKLTRWLSSVDADLPADAVIYLGALKNSQDQYHNAIKFLTDRVVQNPELLSGQILKQLFPIPYLETFDRLSQGVDTFLVMGLARQESAFNITARSPARAEGMMQVLPRVARIKMQSKSRVNLFDIETNIKVGSRLLRDWIRQFGEVEYALIAYNAGPLRVNEWRLRYPTQDMALFIDLIPFKETRNYVGSILRNNYWYHRLYENDASYKALRLQHPETGDATSYYSQLVRDMIIAHGESKN